MRTPRSSVRLCDWAIVTPIVTPIFMSIATLMISLIGVAVLGAADGPLPATQGPDDPGTTRGRLVVDGVERTFVRFIPRSHKPAKPCALVLVLHGGGGQGDGMANVTEHGFEFLAEKDDAVIIYPDGIEKNWYDDREGVDSYAHQHKVDDVGFIRRLVADASNASKIDPDRVYATGISNGAMMCYRLARELPGTFAAIAPVAGLLPVGASTKPWPKPLSTLLIQGSQDPLMPFDGGGVAGSGRNPERGRVLSAADTVRFLVEQDHLTGAARTVVLPDTDPHDATTTKAEIYGAEGGTSVACYVVEGGGHTWPGGRQYLTERIIGKTSHDFEACAVIWEFFAKHPRF